MAYWELWHIPMVVKFRRWAPLRKTFVFSKLIRGIIWNILQSSRNALESKWHFAIFYVHILLISCFFLCKMSKGENISGKTRILHMNYIYVFMIFSHDCNCSNMCDNCMQSISYTLMIANVQRCMIIVWKQGINASIGHKVYNAYEKALLTSMYSWRQWSTSFMRFYILLYKGQHCAYFLNISLAQPMISHFRLATSCLVTKCFTCTTYDITLRISLEVKRKNQVGEQELYM